MSRHAPRKRFGQNFLRDQTVLRSLMASIRPLPDDAVVEIGPGEGALTEPLLDACRALDVVEIDRDLVALLHRRFGQRNRLHIHQADALGFDFAALARSRGANLRVVGNLPYNISTPLLFRLFDQADCLQDMHFMLQKEVVDRLCAQPGSAHYGRLSVMAGYYCQSEPVFDVSPESFWPAPKVISSVVRLRPHPEPPVEVALPPLREVVAAGFAQRRKTLRNALRHLITEADLLALDIDPGRRAQELALDDFARIARRVTSA